MSDKQRAADYSFSADEAKALMGITLLPNDLRHRALVAFMQERSVHALIQAFAQFIGLANSVVENNREMVELILITEGGMHPHTVEKANLPTIFGALNGVILTDGVDQTKTCGGCAYRLGTPANQSPCTTVDADWCAKTEDKFLCHQDLDHKGNPTRKCTGFTQARKRRLASERTAA
jgi:hypothetical protein